MSKSYKFLDASGVTHLFEKVKETIPTESTVRDWGFTKNTGTYSKPTNGIPKTDLTEDIRTSLGKADTALQASDITGKEDKSNKKTTISSSLTDTDYPSGLAVWNYGQTLQSQITINTSEIDKLFSYNDLLTADDVLGIDADFENNTYTRIYASIGLNPGEDFNAFPLYSNIRRCIVARDGVILAYYGETGYTEEGSLTTAITKGTTEYPVGTICRVMVYIPKFHYLFIPIKLVKNTETNSQGYQVRHAKYVISPTPKRGFKLHPAFSIGNEREYILVDAYPGSVYDVSESEYIIDDHTGNHTYDFTATTGDFIGSRIGVTPAHGHTQNFTRSNADVLCKNYGEKFHEIDVFTMNAIQWLMIIEAGKFDMQSVFGQGISTFADGSYCMAVFNGATSSLGNTSGEAEPTRVDGVTVSSTTPAGVKSVNWRGIENIYGNMWTWCNGVNVTGNGSQLGGIPYIATSLSFTDDKFDDGYESVGFTLPNSNNYIKYFGYGNEKFDWLFCQTSVGGNSSNPIGDYSYVTANLNAKRVLILGGRWNHGSSCGPFSWFFNGASTYRSRNFGVRSASLP